MMRKTACLLIFLAIVLANGSATAQQKFEPTKDARREAMRKGQGKEFLSAMEAMAMEAESKKDWERAAMAYNEATTVARAVGQLQKAVSHGLKGMEMGERAAKPALQLDAIRWLTGVYAVLGQAEKERDWLKRGLEIAKQFPPGNREGREASLYKDLGRNYLNKNDANSAIEYLSHSIQGFESQVRYFQSIRRNFSGARLIELYEGEKVSGLSLLGTAYLRAGKPAEAVKAFERGMTVYKAAGVKGFQDGELIIGLGQAYLAQKDFPRALETLSKALQMAEERRQTNHIPRASSGIADVFLQTQKEADAIPYYKRAIELIESTRSLLESEELRTSFFEDKGETYDGIIQANIGTKNFEEAFNYSERARSRAFLDILGNKVQLARSGTMLEHERALQARISVLKAMVEEQEADASGSNRFKKGPGRCRARLQ